MKEILFVEYAFQIKDLQKPHSIYKSNPYVVEKEVTLSKINYENFTTDFCADRWFIEKYSKLCRIDDNGIWHCILVRQKGRTDGVLVMSDGNDFPKWAAYLPSEEEDE